MTVLYVRTSTIEKQDTALQVKDLEAYAHTHGLQIDKIYEDKGYTGTNMVRPSLAELLRDAKSKKFNRLLVWKLDRLGRSLREILAMIAHFEECGVKLVFLKDNIDLTTPVGKFITQILGAVGEFEAAIIKERVIAGVRHAQKHGTKSGKPFGRIRIRNDEAIRNCYLIKKSYLKVAKALQIPIGQVRRSIEEQKRCTPLK